MAKKYTEEQISWIKENVNNKTYNNLKEFVFAFNTLFNENRSVYAIKTKINKDMGLQLGTKHILTENEKKWIFDNYKEYSFNELYNKFNELFPERTISTFSHYLFNYNLYTNTYEKEENEWILNNFYKYDTSTEMLNDFNKIFNRNKTISSFFSHCQRIGLSRYEPPTQEEMEWVINNASIYNYNDLSVKFKRIFNKDISNVLEIKNNLIYIITQDRKVIGERTQRISVSLAKVVWEKYYKEIVPEDYVMVFLNNNKRDFNIENLYPMKNKYLVYMGRNHWYSTNPEVTLTAIKWCELMYATQE